MSQDYEGTNVTPVSSVEVLDNEEAAMRTDQVYAFIAHYSAQFGYSPTLRDIMAAVGLKSVSTAACQLRKLRDAGCLTFENGVARSIRLIHPPNASSATCIVDGCGQPTWPGPRGFNMHLRKCEFHQREEWRNRVVATVGDKKVAQANQTIASLQAEVDELRAELADIRAALKVKQAIRDRIKSVPMPPDDARRQTEGLL